MIPHTKVFVGSLPPGSKPAELRRLFESYGVVTECDIMNRCGFVHMETQEMAENAIRALNNTNFRGSTISVEPGRMKDRAGAGPRQGPMAMMGGGNGGRGGRGGRMGGGGAGMGGGMRRDFNNAGGDGAPRGGFNNLNNQGGGGMRSARGSGIGAAGPMRRDRGFNQRSAPYNRGSGGDGPVGATSFDKWGGSGGPKGGNRNFESNVLGNFSSGPQGGMGGGNMGQADRFNTGSFGMGSQDRRGFALPESRQMFGNDMGSQSRGLEMGGNTGGGGGGFRCGNQGFERRQGGNFSDSGDNFSRRGGPGSGGNMSSGGRGGFNRSSGSLGGGPGGGGGNYNQSFPPLGAGGNR